MKGLRWELLLSSFAIFFNTDLKIEILFEKEGTAETVVQMCSVKKVFLEISQNS